MTPDGQRWTTNQTVPHTWVQATTYQPSLLFYIQHKYDGKGSCSYECRMPAQAKAVVHIKTSPECTGGSFKAANKGAK